MFPWILFGLIAVRLLLVAFVATRRRTAAEERPAASEDLLTEQESAAAEAYEVEWHEQDKQRYREERLP